MIAAIRWVTVGPGDTLSAIASRDHQSWWAIAAWNHLANPDLIHPGDRLRLPPAGYRPPAYMPDQAPDLSVSLSGAAPTAAYASDWSGPWACIAQQESGGNPSADTGNGYYGGLQFTMGTWTANGGVGNPADASIAQQEAVASRALAAGGWGQWPASSAACGD